METPAVQFPDVFTGESSLTWENYVFYLDRFVEMIRQDTQAREEIKKAEIQLRDMEKELSILPPDQPHTVMMQLQHAYQMRKLRFTKTLLTVLIILPSK